MLRGGLRRQNSTLLRILHMLPLLDPDWHFSPTPVVRLHNVIVRTQYLFFSRRMEPFYLPILHSIDGGSCFVSVFERPADGNQHTPFPDSQSFPAWNQEHLSGISSGGNLVDSCGYLFSIPKVALGLQPLRNLAFVV
jgi:hypothetical protein